MGGKEILLKSIAMALPVYAISCFRLTKHHCQKIMSAMASFWWDDNDEKRKLHWISWKKLCISKENGSLGFRDIEDFNQALLAKQAGRLLNERTSLLARIYKGRYFAKSDILECGKGYRPSYAWRSIIFGRDLLKRGLIKSIRDGKTTYVWSQNWIMEDVPHRPINKLQDIAVNLKVSALMDGDGHWDHNILSHLFPENEMQRILKTQVGNAVDRELWAFSKNGAYTVKSGYELASKVKETMALQDASTQPEALELKRSIWKVPTVPKICNFLWRATSGALAVAERLNTRGMHLDSRCKLCLKDGESIEHVLFKCDVAQEAWAIAGFQPLSNFNSMSLVELMSAYLRMMSSDSIPERQRRSIPWILWAIWKNRNLILYADTQESLIFHIQQAFEETRLWNEVNLGQEPVDNLGLNGEKKRWEAPFFWCGQV